MQHTPAPEYDAETIEAAAARVAAMNLNADKPLPSVSDPDPVREAEQDKKIDRQNQTSTPPARAPRSDKGVQRGPKAPGLPEAAATVETTASGVGAWLTVELTAIQYADLEREAARVYRDIEPRYLTEAPATVLLNSRVQKHWRTLVGKVTA